MSDLSQISIGIKTFLRDDKLFRTIDAIRRTLPGMNMIIADDGEMTEEKDGLYADLTREGHQVILLDFDSGFGKKSNAIADALVRPYLLNGSDDFDFYPAPVKVGIEKMLATFDRLPILDVASGRVNERVYEFSLTERQPGEWYERVIPGSEYFRSVVICELTVNYSLIRRKVFEKVRWDDDVKIGGGEHGAFFIDLKRAGFMAAFVPGVNIYTQEGRDSERYRAFRNRARGPERPCFERRGVRKYVLGNGQIDYERKD